MRSNEILTAVIHGARKEESSQEVQLAAIQALLNSLEFVRDNFEREVRSYSLKQRVASPDNVILRARGITSCR